MDGISPKDFYTAVLTAGTVLTGFTGSFLQFRIQREANYYRQPVLDFETGKAKDVAIGLSHFSSSFLLLICAVVLEIAFGFILPLLAMADVHFSFLKPNLIVAGLIAALIILAGYFCAELVHYRILNTRLLHDKAEWGRQWAVVSITLALAILFGIACFLLLR
jgi:hypothetical protein